VDTKVSNLRRWREQHKLRLIDVADLTGLSIYKLSRLETGFTRFHPLDKVKIAQALGVRVKDIFPGG
jgi:transcriptional regulator with XRE-family HTH domain